MSILEEKELSKLSKKDWFNTITRENCKQENIDYANKMYYKYKCKNLNDYVKLYLEIDVLLLAEVFEKFIDTSLTRYKLDPSWFYTTPGYAWYYML